DLPTYAFRHRRFWPDAVAADSDDAFWAAVDSGDVSELAAALDVDDEKLGDLLPALAAYRRRRRGGTALDDRRYRVTWSPVAEAGPAVLSGTWLVVGDPAEAPPVAAALTARGAEVVTATAGSPPPSRPLAGVVSLLALDERPVDGTATAGLVATLDLVQAGIEAPLWVLTRGAVATAPGEPASPAQAQVWGLGRVVALEHPDRWGGLIDLPATLDESTAARLVGVLAGAGEDQVALRPRGILARRLTRAGRPRAGESWHPRGTVLVTGGTGTLGAHAARWAGGRGADRVVLTADTPVTAETARLAAALAGKGTAVDVAGCDTTRRTQVAGLLDRLGPLSAVVHADGVGQATAVADTSAAELTRIATAKAAGAAWLDELAGDLDAFVVFSSIAATWGSALVGGYAAGNAFLDALAERRRAAGKPATAVAWGPWAGGPEAGRSVRHGLRTLDPDLAVRALGQILDAGEDAVTVADVDWAAFAPAFTVRRPSPLLAAVPEAATALAAPESEVDSDFAGRLAGMPRPQQDQLLTDLVRTEAARVLDHTGPADVAPDRAFSALGFDSLTSVELRNRLAAATGVRLPSTVVFEFPTAAALAAHLRDELVGEPGEPDVARQLADAGDDEIFDFIGKEFGIQ
ncbi:KR domain-containing protein, partial [Amycolatopsis sp.]|uniref:KR domain-containing protein n=1 Tax=Amycolatopsis sp. TaxID=37632 RepID=UPI002D7FF1F1